MKQVQKQNLDELMQSILEDMSEEERKEVDEYTKLFKPKNIDDTIKNIDSLKFMLDANLITRYINALFNGTYDKSYLEIEKLLNELPLDKCFFYDSKLLEEFNKCVYLFVLFEAANNRFELLNNRNIADIVNKEAYNKIININRSEDKYIPFDLYMAIKELSDNRSRDMFLSKELLIQLYYYELNISHVSSVRIEKVDKDLDILIKNLNVNKNKWNEVKKEHKTTLDSLKREAPFWSAVAVLGPILVTTFVALANGPYLEIRTYNQETNIEQTVPVDETFDKEQKYILEYNKTDENKLIVKVYKISLDKATYAVSKDELYSWQLTDDDLVKTIEYDLNKEENVEELRSNKYIHYDENNETYRTIVCEHNPVSKLAIVGLGLAGSIIFWGGVSFCFFGMYSEIFEIMKEYKKHKKLSTESLEKSSALINKIRNQLLIAKPGMDVSNLEEHNFRI